MWIRSKPICLSAMSTIIPVSYTHLELLASLKQHHVKIHADSHICALDTNCIPATEEDYASEYLNLEISIKTVSTLEEAITHINTYSTHHSEAIISENYTSVKRFLKEVDSACVYANASTRFSDGFEFGLGEMCIRDRNETPV